MYLFAIKQRNKLGAVVFIGYYFSGLARLRSNCAVCGPWTKISLTPKSYSLNRPFFTWGNCLSPPRRRLRLFWKNEWISAFSIEVVRSMESRERAFSSQRVREKVNATTGVCCRWDRKCRRVSHTARSCRDKNHEDVVEGIQRDLGVRREMKGITWLAEVFWEVFFVPKDWACLLVRSFLASTAA